MRHDPIALYRHALRCDKPLVEALPRVFRRSPTLSQRADQLLQTLPRRDLGSPSWPEMRVFHRVAAALDPL